MKVHSAAVSIFVVILVEVTNTVFVNSTNITLQILRRQCAFADVFNKVYLTGRMEKMFDKPFGLNRGDGGVELIKEIISLVKKYGNTEQGK